MARADGRVVPGQRLTTAFSARAWNRAQDAADLVLAEQRGFGVDPARFPGAPYIALPMLNASSQDVERWGALQIDGLQTTPTTVGEGGTPQFEQMPVLTGVMPAGTTGRFAVALEPVAQNTIGRFAVDGVVQAKVRIISANDRYVRTRNGFPGLQTGGYGDGLILWKETTTGDDKWALIRLGSPAGGALIRFSGAWVLDTTKTVSLADTSDTIDVVNRFASINASCGERYGAAIAYGNTWYLIAAQFE